MSRARCLIEAVSPRALLHQNRWSFEVEQDYDVPPGLPPHYHALLRYAGQGVGATNSHPLRSDAAAQAKRYIKVFKELEKRRPFDPSRYGVVWNWLRLTEAESPRSVLKRLRFPVRAIDKAGLRQFLRAWGFRVRELRVGKHVATSYLTIEPKVTEDDLKSVELNLYDWLHKQNPAADWDVLLYQDFGEWDPAWGSEPKYRIKYPDLVYLRIMVRRPEPVEEPTNLFGEAILRALGEGISPRELLRSDTPNAIRNFLKTSGFADLSTKKGEMWQKGWLWHADLEVKPVPGGWDVTHWRVPSPSEFGRPRRKIIAHRPKVPVDEVVPLLRRVIREINLERDPGEEV